MSWFGVVFRLSVLVAFVAAYLMLPSFHEHRQQLASLLSTCPLHWFEGGDVRQPIKSTSDAPSVIRSSDDRLFTVDELKQFDGNEGSRGLCVAVLGSVYDVSAGSKHYGPNGGYSFFAGSYFNSIAQNLYLWF
jgi:Cytochrome b5-like Heme/Steroid binding domain